MELEVADEMCDGKVVALLEGGYDLRVWPACLNRWSVPFRVAILGIDLICSFENGLVWGNFLSVSSPLFRRNLG